MKRLMPLVFILVPFICYVQKGKIYFTSGLAKNRMQKNIGVINPDGSGYHEVTFTVSSRSEYQPHVSCDGKKMTFNTYRYGGWKVAIADSNGGNVSNLTSSNNYEYDASWSPNSDKVALVGFESGNSGKRKIYIYDLKTGSKTKITDGNYAYYSPSFLNEDELIFSRITNGQYGIYKMNINQKNDLKLIDSPDYHEFAPKVSPDGKYLAFHRVNAESEIELVVMDLENKEEKVVYKGWSGSKEKIPDWETPLFPYSIGWAPNSDYLVFTSRIEDYNFELLIIDKEGNNLSRLTNNPGVDSQPHWSIR